VGEPILVLEDDPELGALIVNCLAHADFRPTWRQNGDWIANDVLSSVGLVVLDLMLPGIYGMDILKDLRRRSEVPVLVLSARHDSADKVRALRLGADDYMTKPFWPEELVERVRARLRRPRLARSEWIEVGSVKINLQAHVAYLGDQALVLTPVEFDFLCALASRPGEAISRRWLIENVLDPARDASERALDAHVSRLRKKLGSTPMIETVWGIGYRFIEGCRV
jgi:two-component system response regulator MtrA